MRYWLLTANPAKQGNYPITSDHDFVWYLNMVKSWGNWSVDTKKIKPGDVFYLLIIGQEQYDGIIARGKFKSWAYEDPVEKVNGNKNRYADISFEPYPKYIAKKTLEETFPEQDWSEETSGVSIKSRYAAALDRLYDTEGVELA